MSSGGTASGSLGAATSGPAGAATPPLAVALRHAAVTPRAGVRALFSNRSFLRLWAIGGCVNAMRWFEVLAAAFFTLDATGSDLAVAAVTAARTMPMLILGAFAGVMSEAVDRKRVMVIGQCVAAAASATVVLLAMLGCARPWHVAIAALVSGTSGQPRCPPAAAWWAKACRRRWCRAPWRSTP